jgi:hypothetical protein
MDRIVVRAVFGHGRRLGSNVADAFRGAAG